MTDRTETEAREATEARQRLLDECRTEIEIVYRDAQVVQRYRYAPTLLEAIRSAHTRPVTPHYAQFSETFRAVVRAALDILAEGSGTVELENGQRVA